MAARHENEYFYITVMANSFHRNIHERFAFDS